MQIAPSLRAVGITVERSASNGKRGITITRVVSDASDAEDTQAFISSSLRKATLQAF